VRDDQPVYYRTLDDMSDAEKDALCRHYGAPISRHRKPFEDAPWKMTEDFVQKRTLVMELMGMEGTGQFVRKSCAKFISDLELNGFLTEHQVGLMTKWKKQYGAKTAASVSLGGLGPVAGSPRAPCKPAAKLQRKSKPKPRKRP
jgi:hypothetical protein